MAHDLRLEERHALTIAGILGKTFVTKDVRADLKDATDFAVFTVRPFGVGARLRTYSYDKRYHQQFTLRWSRPSGVDTEIDKIMEGLVDYIFYGFVSRDESRIVRYFIGDLAVFRSLRPEPLAILPNTPCDSELAAFHIRDCGRAFVVKSWPDSWASRLFPPYMRSGAP